MDFTREPIIESVITPKEGCKLVVRSSKGAGQEEFFVDSLEVVSFGNTFFLRSRERPKSFLVPATDYEVLEVRETRMVLKNVGLDKSIKIGGGREPSKRAGKETSKGETAKKEAVVAAEPKPEPKRKERRRSQRRRRGREEVEVIEKPTPEPLPNESFSPKEATQAQVDEGSESAQNVNKRTVPSERDFRALLAPPPSLISETIERYKGDETFKDVFYTSSEESVVSEEQSGEVNHFEEKEEIEDSPTEQEVVGQEPVLIEEAVEQGPSAEEEVVGQEPAVVEEVAEQGPPAEEEAVEQGSSAEQEVVEQGFPAEVEVADKVTTDEEETSVEDVESTKDPVAEEST